MNFTDSAVVLIKRDIRESDRIVSVYTRNRGRMNIRFPGVNKHSSRLKAFTEPFVWADMRIYIRQGAAVGCGTGGKIQSVFPGIRADARKTQLALHFCELMFRLTPELQANEDKFTLLLHALRFLNNNSPLPSTRAAFTFRLMQTAGFGLSEPVLGISGEFWDKLHHSAFETLAFASPLEKEELAKSEYVLTRFFSRTFAQGLKTLPSITAP
ncbi:MAG: DNA repair protein RecO [Elusimicrobiaceae bacterium]